MAAPPVTHVETLDDNSNSTQYSFTTATPTANRLLVVIYYVTGTAIDATVSDTSGLSWTQQVVLTTSATFAIWTAESGSSPSSTTINIDTDAGDAGTGCLGALWEVAGYNTTTPVPSGQATADDTGSGGTTPSWTPPSALNTGNSYIAAVFNVTNPAAITEPSNWTEDADVGHSLPTAGMEAAHRAGGESSSTVNWGGTSPTAYRVLGIEIAAAPVTFRPINLPLLGVG